MFVSFTKGVSVKELGFGGLFGGFWVDVTFLTSIDNALGELVLSSEVVLIGTVYRNSSSSTNNNYCLSRSSPEDPVNLKFRSVHVLHGPMRA